MESTEESQKATYAKRGFKTANKGRKAYNKGSRLHMLWKILLALLVIGLALGLGLGLGLKKKGGGDDDDDDNDDSKRLSIAESDEASILHCRSNSGVAD